MTDHLCREPINDYIFYIQNKFSSQKIENGCHISTPFLYPDFASIEFTIFTIGDKYILTDDNETLNMLYINGLSTESNKDLWRLVKRIAKNYHVEIGKDGISVITQKDGIGEATYNLLNAVQSISFLIHKRRKLTYSTFNDEVEKTLIQNDVKYDYNFIIRGEAIEHKVKFHINSNRNILIEPISAGNYQSARNKSIKTVFKWIDIGKVNPIMRFITVIDDREDKWKTVWKDEEAQRTLSSYSTEVIRWEAEKSKFVNLIS